MNILKPTEEELLLRLRWFVQLRWLFLLGLAVVIFFARKIFNLEIEHNWIPIYIIGVLVFLYNVGFYIRHWLVRKHKESKVSPRELRIEANLQIGLDLMALIFLIHYSGGIENPFIFFFIFHMIMGSILLSRLDIWFQAIGAIFILMLLLGLSYFGIIPHYHINGFAHPGLWLNKPYIWAGAVSFSLTILMTIYMTTSIAQSLRKRERELFETKNQLEKKSQELEQVNKEIIRQQQLLIQSEKLASLGKLSAGVAHELNSPLTGILSFAHFIKDTAQDNPQIQCDIEVVIRETERCKKIIKSLLDFARQSQPEKKKEDLLAILSKTISLIENHKDFKNIKIIKDFPESLPLIMLDRDQIQQVFMNLLVNAQEAMPKGGSIYITVNLTQDKKYIQVLFSDTGIGISEENLNRIFDPFFTTKEKGTGLGLSIVLGIVENHGGELEVKSRIGEGTTFIIKLPTGQEGE